MKVILSTIILICLVMFQISFLPYLKIYETFPNLLLVAIVAWLILHQVKEGIYWAFLGGFICDLFSQNMFGAYALSLLVILFILYFLINHFVNKDDLYSRLFLVTLASLFFYLFFIGSSWIASKLGLISFHLSFSWHNLKTFFIQVIFNSLAMLVVYKLVSGFKNFIRNYQAQIRLKI